MHRPALLTNPAPVSPAAPDLPSLLERAARARVPLRFARGDAAPHEHGWASVYEDAQCAAAHLLALGLSPGDRVLLALPTQPAWLAAFFGAQLAGCTPVPVGPTRTVGSHDRHAAVLAHVARDSGARLAIAPEGLASTALSGVLPCITPEALTAGPATSAPSRSLDACAPAFIQYTSGTTSRPKGVVISHRAACANAYLIGDAARIGAADAGVSWLPLFHDMGLVGALLTSLAWHMPLTLMQPEDFLLHPRRWLEALSRDRATMTVGPNFAYQHLVDRLADRHVDALDLSRIRVLFSGSEAVRLSTVERFNARFAPRGLDQLAFAPVYGMAECTLAVTFSPMGARCVARSPDGDGGPVLSVGKPLAGTSVSVRGPSFEVLAEGALGEIAVQSPSLMSGYHGRDAGAELRDGWYRTGDLGFIREGELHVAGRASERIVKRGRKLDPAELEGLAVEAGAPLVKAAAAFSCGAAADGSEKVVLALEVPSCTAHEAEQLRRRTDGEVATALGVRPDETLLLPPGTITRTTSGKVQRAALREAYLAGSLTTGAAR